MDRFHPFFQKVLRPFEPRLKGGDTPPQNVDSPQARQHVRIL